MVASPSAAVPFDQVRTADLVVDREYSGGASGTMADDPLARMFPVGNQGGFRVNGSIAQGTVRLVVLYSTGVDPDWPDTLDPETGDFTYYGDNKTPGSALHETSRRGNLLLRDIFDWSRRSPEDRREVPPILLFEKSGTTGRTVRFRGLLAPGSARLTAEEELVALWRTTRHHRFQNYRSHFTVLDATYIPRAWVDEVLAGEPLGPHCPAVWRRWVQGRIYDALEAPRTVTVRSKDQQYPSARHRPLLDAVHEHFSPRPVAFEQFAADLWLRSDPNVEAVDVTRPSRDGGRDAIGTYLVGPRTDPVRISFALEAKCLRPEGSGVGVRMVSRLISRIKHRDFGVFVTTAHIGAQPYKEVREDGHPVVFLTGGDIVDHLRGRGLRTADEVRAYLADEYPLAEGEADVVAPAVETVYSTEGTGLEVGPTEEPDPLVARTGDGALGRT